jgi:serine/threonine protein kinase
MTLPEKRVFGRYTLHRPIASGGMATVYYGRHVGPAGFARTVAIKRLHPHLADPEFVTGMLDEARLAARIHHPNVVQTIDVVAVDGELLLVMDYVQGESLAKVLSACSKRKLRPPPNIVSAVMINVLHGLHAAHEARSETGEPLAIVHRDVSPQNVLVGADGVSRVLDFGVAKAANRLQTTRDGAVKGKLGYMSPEQAMGQRIDRRSDVFSAGVVLYEALTARRLFAGEDPGAIIFKILHDPLPKLPDELARPMLSAVVAKAMARKPDERYATALDFAIDLEAAIPPATPREIGTWLASIVGDILAQRAEEVAEFERTSANEQPVVIPPSNPATPSSNPAASSVGPSASAPTGVPVTISMTASPSSGPSFAAAAPTPPPGRRRASTLLLAVGVLVVAGAAYGFGRAAQRREATTATQAATSASAIVTAADPESEPTAIAVAPLAASVPSAAVSASASAIPPATRPRVTTKTAPAKPASGRGKPGECDNPFVMDENGIKHVKPGCIR